VLLANVEHERLEELPEVDLHWRSGTLRRYLLQQHYCGENSMKRHHNQKEGSFWFFLAAMALLMNISLYFAKRDPIKTLLEKTDNFDRRSTSATSRNGNLR